MRVWRRDRQARVRRIQWQMNTQRWTPTPYLVMVRALAACINCGVALCVCRCAMAVTAVVCAVRHTSSRSQLVLNQVTVTLTNNEPLRPMRIYAY